MSTEIPPKSQHSASGDADGKGHSISRQGATVALMTLLSRISGLLRDMVLAYLFGASAVADMFFVAFRIPNFFRRLFAEGAFSQAFVPVLMQFKLQGQGALVLFLADLSGVFAASLAVFLVLGVALAPMLTAIFAPGFVGDPQAFALTAELVRIMFPYLGFISLTAYAGALLNAHGYFALPAVTPVLLNVCLIAAALIALDDGLALTPVVILAWGVFAAGILQCLLQLPRLSALGLLPRPRLSLKHPGTRQVGTLLLPAMFAASVGQINAVVNTALASTLIGGSISWLYYADRLLELPVGLVAVALGTVLLPHLSQMAASERTQAFRATLNWGIHLGMALGVPAAVALWLLATPLLATLYMSFTGGAMTAHDIAMTAAALVYFAVALPGFVLVKILAPAFFAQHDTMTPFRYASVAVAVNLAVGLSTYSWMGHLGLALATAASAWVHALLLLFGLYRRSLFVPDTQLFRSLARVLLTSGLLAAGLVFLAPSDQAWMMMPSLDRLLGVVVTCVLGLLGYGLLLLLFGLRRQDLMRDNRL